jgi:hypothetical protein
MKLRNALFFLAVVAFAGAAAAGILPPDVAAELAMVGMAGTVQTAAGATLRISATIPGTFNLAGYQAIFDASPAPALVGEITDFGDFGREYNPVNHNPVASRGTQKFKGSFNEGQMNLQIGLDEDDTGQTLMQTARDSDSDYSFALELQNGDRYFFQAKVLGFKISVGSVDSIVSAATTLDITTSSAGVGVVKDPA